MNKITDVYYVFLDKISKTRMSTLNFVGTLMFFM